MSNEDGMRLGELEGIVGEEDGYTAESDAAILLQGLDIPDALHEKTMDVTRQLERGDAVIVYDETSGTTNIVPRRDG